MTAGLYLLAGPFRSERSDAAHLLPRFGVLTLYEFAVIGMIAILGRRGVGTAALRLVSAFFLADPVFLGDAFTSIDAGSGLLITGSAALLSLLKAWALARACAFPLTPWRAGWVSAALIGIHLIPNLNAAAGAQPAFVIAPLTTAVLAALSVPLWRQDRLGRAAVAALGVHFVATFLVASLDFQLELLTGPLLAAAVLLPWPRFGWIPLPAAIYTSPLRPWLHGVGSTLEGVGAALVGIAFVLLGVGFWASLRTPAAPALPQKQTAA